MPGRGTERTGKAKLAVFDFDGTCIKGSSTVAFTKHLAAKRLIGLWADLRIAGWCIFYLLHLPQNESWVREIVFEAFEGWPCEKVDEFMGQVYDEKIACRWRPQALRTMEALDAAGYEVLIVSATFDQIGRRAIEGKPIRAQVSTLMAKGADGCYTGSVDGVPVEGSEKLEAFRRLADREFGPGNWELAYSFGDHYSDRDIMEAAAHPVAVSPDWTLLRHARRHGWTVLDWDNPAVGALDIDSSGK